MYVHLRKFIPAVASFMLGTAVNVSGVQSPALAAVLAALGMILLAWPVWEQLIAGVRARSWRQKIGTLSGEPPALLFGGSAVVTVLLSISPMSPTTTSFGWLIIFLAVTVMFGAVWLGAAWIYSRGSPPSSATIPVSPQARPDLSRFRISLAEPHVSEPLAKLVARADEMIERTVTSEGEFGQWKAGYSLWLDDTLSSLRRLVRGGESAALAFSELAAIYYGEVRSFNKEHESMLHRLKRQRKWLREKQALHMD